MKILFFDNAGMNFDGHDYFVETNTGDFAKELKMLGHEVTFFGQFLPFLQNNIHVFGIIENGLNAKGVKRKRRKILTYVLLYLKVIPEILKTDYVYLFFPSAFKFVPMFCVLFRKKYGIYIRGMKSISTRTSVGVYKNADVVCTVSGCFTEFVKEKCGAYKKVFTIRPMISLREADIYEDRVYNIPSVFNILYLGRVTKDKGLEELIHAINNIDKNFNFVLKIVGTGEFLEELKFLSNSFDLTRIQFEGAEYSRDKIRNYYLNADIFVLPSHHEGFPRTLYEAMVFGVPIITTIVGGIPFIMKDGYNCKAIIPKSEESIVDALTFAFENYTEMGRMARNGTLTVKGVLGSKRLSHAMELHHHITAR